MTPAPITPASEETQDAEDGTKATAQERIDEAMAESFPASDPPSWNAGVRQKEDHLTEDSSRQKEDHLTEDSST